MPKKNHALGRPIRPAERKNTTINNNKPVITCDVRLANAFQNSMSFSTTSTQRKNIILMLKRFGWLSSELSRKSNS
ncbi:hypothetical protein ACSAZL_17130 [Methanosarcina sp. T3]|uniref:hypothetical protein n=1 Tax=Methanosarcina sp. T3 TaxID=3439062 RepID=UPI003F86CF37